MKIKLGTSTGISVGRIGIQRAGGGAAADTTAPTVTAFAATTPSNSTTVTITSFTATDAVGVTGYLITESSTPPLAGAAGWTGSAPTTFAVSGSTGGYTLYPWAKDAAGNVSSVYGSPVTVVVIVAVSWFKADTVTGLYQTNDTSTPVTADGQSVGYVADNGSANRPATQATAGSRPTYKTNIQNGLSALLGDGGDFLKTAAFAADLSQPNTIFIVLKNPVVGSENYHGGIVSGKQHTVYNNSNHINWFGGSDIFGTVNSPTDTTFMISTIFNGASSFQYKNGTQISSGNIGSHVLSGVTLFADYAGTACLSGYIMEFILVNAALGTTARQAVESYLNAKWSIF